MNHCFSTLDMIRELSDAPGVSGFEDEVLQVGRKYLSEIAEIREDTLRNLYFYRKKNTGHRPVVMLDCHSDELGFMVQAIKPNGTLQFITLGGWAESNIPAHTVLVRNAQGKYIRGIVSAKPVHFMTEEERKRPPAVSQMTIDIGSTSLEETVSRFQIQVGAPVVPDVSCSYDPENDLLLGKAFDNRLGCASVVETLWALESEQLSVDVVGTFAAQEEVGVRGSQVTANTVRPDLCIVFEGSPADDTFTPDYAIQTAIKKGPMLRHIDKGMITNPRLIRYALELCEQLGIPVQQSVRSGGSTNGAKIHLSNQGVPCLVIGLPVRYIHSHYGFATLSDFHHSVKLAVELIKRLNQEMIGKL